MKIRKQCAQTDDACTSQLILRELTGVLFDNITQLRLERKIHSKVKKPTESLYKFAQDTYDLCHHLYATDWHKANEAWWDAMNRGIIDDRRDYYTFFEKHRDEAPHVILKTLRGLGEHRKDEAGVSGLDASDAFLAFEDSLAGVDGLNEPTHAYALEMERATGEDHSTCMDVMHFWNVVYGVWDTYEDVGRECDVDQVAQALIVRKPPKFQGTTNTWISDLRELIGKVTTQRLLELHKLRPIPMLDEWHTDKFRAFRKWWSQVVNSLLGALGRVSRTLAGPEPAEAGAKPANPDAGALRKRRAKAVKKKGGAKNSSSPAPTIAICTICGRDPPTGAKTCPEGTSHLCTACLSKPAYKEMYNGPNGTCYFCEAGIQTYQDLELKLASQLMAGLF